MSAESKARTLRQRISDMEIKKLQSSPIQQKATETSDPTANRISQTGVGRVQDGFDEVKTISDENKLLSDDEISSTQGSRDMFQIVDQPATTELGNEKPANNKALRRHKRMSSRIKDHNDD